MKKILCLLLSILMCGIMITPIYGEVAPQTDPLVSSEVCNAISYELSIFENEKSLIGFSNVNYYNLYISEAIHIYEYTEKGFQNLSTAYLLFENDSIVSLAYQVNTLQFQFMNYLASSIQKIDATSGALIYDANGCYFFDGSQFLPLGYTDSVIEGRSQVSLASYTDTLNLELTNLNNKQKLNYVPNTTGIRTPANYTCSVSYITQDPYKNLCWAATFATISNYVNNTSYDAVTVAKALYGETDFNKGITTSQATSLFQAFGLYYSYVGYPPSDNTLVANLRNGYPIYGIFNHHAVTVYGVNVTAGRIMLMDPQYGSITSYYDTIDGYSYIHPVSGIQMIFGYAFCKTVTTE